MRRSTMQITAFAALLIVLAVADAATKKMPKNVLIFWNDQQNNMDWFPKGFAEKNLPLWNQLTKNGMKFKNAFTNANMCTSARVSLVTGLYNSQHQSTLTLTSPNQQSPYEVQLSNKINTIGHMLKANDYEVVYFGKNHLSKGYFNATTGQYVHDDLSRFGFGTQSGVSQWNGEPPLGTRGIMGFGGNQTMSRLDTYAVGNATVWLKDRMAREAKAKAEGKKLKPFFLVVSTWNPHDMPLAYPGLSANSTNPLAWNTSNFMVEQPGVERKYWLPKWWAAGYTWDNMTATDPPIEIPPTNRENLPTVNTTSGVAEYQKTTSIKPTAESYFLVVSNLGLGPCMTLECQQNYTNLYARGVIMSDQSQSPIYELLRTDPELLADTIVVKFSDHGDMMMAHGGQRQKPFMPYRESLGVPLVWSNPVLFPNPIESDALVSHVDFIPTLMDMLGLNWKQYKLPGKSYLSVLLGEKTKIQDYVLFEFNDRWATFNAQSPSPGYPQGGPPSFNLFVGLSNYPITNQSNGMLPPPAEIMVMNTLDFTAAINYDQSVFPVPEEESCYDNTPTGGDYNAKYGVPTQLINLSPWANKIRASLGLPPAGTEAQRHRCQELLDRLRKRAKKAFTPMPRLPFQPVPTQRGGPGYENLTIRVFDNPAKDICNGTCAEILLWTAAGQFYSVFYKTIGQGGVPYMQQIYNVRQTQGLPALGSESAAGYRFVNFGMAVPGQNGPTYLIIDVPSGTSPDDIHVKTAWTEEQRLSLNYISPKIPFSGCLTDCNWNQSQHNGPPNPQIVAAIDAWQAMH